MPVTLINLVSVPKDKELEFSTRFNNCCRYHRNHQAQGPGHYLSIQVDGQWDRAVHPFLCATAFNASLSVVDMKKTAPALKTTAGTKVETHNNEGIEPYNQQHWDVAKSDDHKTAIDHFHKAKSWGQIIRRAWNVLPCGRILRDHDRRQDDYGTGSVCRRRAKTRRLVFAKVEFHFGELFPRVGSSPIRRLSSVKRVREGGDPVAPSRLNREGVRTTVPGGMDGAERLQ